MSFLGAGSSQMRNIFGNLSVAQRNTLTDPYAQPGQGFTGLGDIWNRLPVAQRQPFLSGFTNREGLGELPSLNFQPITAGDIGRGVDSSTGVLDGGFKPITAGDIDRRYRSAFSPTQQGAGQPLGTGQMASLGGDWSGVDQWNAQIQAAASQTGVPANLIKAVMRLESGGDPNSVSVAGATGLMQIMPFWNGTSGLSIHDPSQNILLGATILKQNYDQYGDWNMAIRAYLGFGQDAYGTTDQAYLQRVTQYWNELDAGGGSFYGGGSGASGDVGSMFPGGAVPDWGEFNVPSSNGLYGYGTQYGMNGVNHTGVDVPMAIGTPYYAPLGGVVTCGGTGMGSGADGGGCAAFGDTNGGAGRVEVLLDNGAVLIFGHSSRAAVRPGQRVNAGMLLGYSGFMVSPHIHLEARVRDSSTPSGWRIVDPRSVLGGAGMSGQQRNTQQQTGGYGSSPQQRLIQMLRG